MPHSAADPLIALAKRWEATRSEITEADSDAVCDTLSARLQSIERQMVALVATTPQGLAAQVLILRDLVPDDYGPLVDNALLALKTLLP